MDMKRVRLYVVYRIHVYECNMDFSCIFYIVAPEQLEEEKVYAQTDVWRLGVLFYILLSGVSPFKDEDDTQTRQNVQFVRFQFQHLHSNTSQEANHLILHIFKKAPL